MNSMGQKTVKYLFSIVKILQDEDFLLKIEFEK